MTAASAPAAMRPRPATRRRGWAPARLLRLELRHNAMLWMLPVVAGLFWLTTYRKTMAMPPLWDLRAPNLQTGAVIDFASPVVGAAAWMGSRDGRRHITDQVTITARPRCARLLATWAATTCWALVAYLGCVAVLYGVTAHQAAWGGPLWWPAVVGAASLPALAGLGFAAGVLLPSRFTAPLAAVAAFFVIALSTQLIHGSQSYWQISPIVTGPWDLTNDPGVGTFYHYLPDLSVAQVIFLAGLTVAVLGALALPRGSGGPWLRAAAAAGAAAGLLAAGTAVALAGSGRLNAHGMIAIPALHDAASDRPIRFTPVCSDTTIPVCVNPAYAMYLPAAVTALEPVLSEIAGLPGAPVRITQAAATYYQGAGNEVSVGLAGPPIGGRPPVFRLLLSDQLAGPVVTTSELAAEVRSGAGTSLLASVIGDGPGASQAQHAIMAALMMAAGLPTRGRSAGLLPPGSAPGSPVYAAPGSPAYAAAQRFAARPASARHAWLRQHLVALRAGRITLAQLP
jgi:hypothetical protein